MKKNIFKYFLSSLVLVVIGSIVMVMHVLDKYSKYSHNSPSAEGIMWLFLASMADPIKWLIAFVVVAFFVLVNKLRVKEV